MSGPMIALPTCTRRGWKMTSASSAMCEERIEASFAYTPVSSSDVVEQKLWPALTHFFNHQTHHRGQVHAGLTSLGKPSLSLDLIYFVRSEGKAYC